MLRYWIRCAIVALAIMPGAVQAQDTLTDHQASCPVTQASAPLFRFGSGKLWVTLRDGPWHGVRVDNGARRVKFPWFADDLGSEENDQPDLVISGRPLQSDRPALRVEGPHLAWAGSYALTSVLVFPSPGCWEIRAKRKQSQIRFVVWVSQ